jgi:hypothetical protein
LRCNIQGDAPPLEVMDQPGRFDPAGIQDSDTALTSISGRLFYLRLIPEGRSSVRYMTLILTEDPQGIGDRTMMESCHEIQDIPSLPRAMIEPNVVGSIDLEGWRLFFSERGQVPMICATDLCGPIPDMGEIVNQVDLASFFAVE